MGTISLKLGTNHFLVKMIQVFSNERLCPFAKGDTFNLFPLMLCFDAPVISLESVSGFPLDHFRQADRQLKTQLIESDYFILATYYI